MIGRESGLDDSNVPCVGHQGQIRDPNHLHAIHPQQLKPGGYHGVRDDVDEGPQLPARAHHLPELVFDVGDNALGMIPTE